MILSKKESSFLKSSSSRRLWEAAEVFDLAKKQTIRL